MFFFSYINLSFFSSEYTVYQLGSFACTCSVVILVRSDQTGPAQIRHRRCFHFVAFSIYIASRIQMSACPSVYLIRNSRWRERRFSESSTGVRILRLSRIVRLWSRRATTDSGSKSLRLMGGGRNEIGGNGRICFCPCALKNQERKSTRSGLPQTLLEEPQADNCLHL